jgi:predicted phosphoribosyltransferase
VGTVHELIELRDRRQVFHDRAHAGRLLASMLPPGAVAGSSVLAIPAGGVPVAASLAARLGVPLDVAVVSKITPRWNPEVGYGAVAFDGSVALNPDLISRFETSEDEVRARTEETARKVAARVARLRAGRPPLDPSAGPVLLVDDGLASGTTMALAVRAVRAAGARTVLVVVPTGHEEAVRRLAEDADAVYCANVRAGARFSVAAAYEHWCDVSEDEAERLLAGQP